MVRKYLSLFFLALSIVPIAYSDSTTTDRGADYLNGEGTFTSTNLAKWTQDTVDSSVTFSSVTVDGVDALKIVKSSEAPLAFLDYTLTYTFSQTIKPVHLMFDFYSSSVETEDTNLRLLNTGLNKTVVLFRCGNAGFVRVNDNQMISFYNSTIEGKEEADVTTTPTWTRADIFLDWEEQQLRVYLNQTYMADVNFYVSGVTEGIDAVRVYNLKPSSTGFFKDIELCSEPTCDGYLASNIITLSTLMMICLFTILYV